MEVRFIGQGLYKDGDQLGSLITDALMNDKYNQFLAFVAFVSEGGVDRLKSALSSFNNRGDIKLFIGVDNKATSKEALEVLLKVGIPTYIFHTPSKHVIYHPKVYLFKGKNEFKLIVGSSNLTTTGLYQNVESSVLIGGTLEEGEKVLKELEDFFTDFLNNTDDNLSALDRALIDILDDAGKIPSEDSRGYSGEVVIEDSPSYGKTPTSSYSSRFPSRKVPTAPPRTTTAGKGKNSGNDSEGTGAGTGSRTGTGVTTGVRSGTTPKTRTIWFESGKLTGGSANILDLSLTGKNGGSGGVELLNPTLVNNHSITIRFHGTDYMDNIVKYPVTPTGESNGTWRLQMKGISSSGQRFTDNTRLGQLKDKILVLNEIGPDHYDLNVEPNTRLGHYQSVSSFVDQSPPRGRFYGEL